MGLDMYLNGKRYLSSVFRKEDRIKMKAIAKLFPELAGRVSRFGDTAPIKQVEIEVGYWRKANAIHDWFVREVQGGTDNCGHYYVSREQLSTLRGLCQEILDDQSKAKDLLPTSAGFFFGSTDYDEGYFFDLDDTIRIIDSCLSLPEEWDFEYHSSW